MFVQMLAMQHDNVCKFIGACADPGFLCIVMSACSNGTLQVLI